jgi:hypothetical protein
MAKLNSFLMILMLCFCCACEPLKTQTQQYNPQLDFIGTYHGKVVSGTDLIPVKTVFVGDKNGLKSGSYVMTEVGGKQVPGTLDEFKQEGPYTYLASWHDKYGNGKLRMLFSDGGYVFKGFWGATIETSALKFSTQTYSAWDGYKVHEK